MYVRYHITAAKRFLMFIKPWTPQIIKTYSLAIKSRCLIWKEKWNLLLFLQRSRTEQEWVLLGGFAVLLFALGNRDLVWFLTATAKPLAPTGSFLASFEAHLQQLCLDIGMQRPSNRSSCVVSWSSHSGFPSLLGEVRALANCYCFLALNGR